MNFGPFVLTNSTEPTPYKRKNGDVVLLNLEQMIPHFPASLPKESDEVPQLEWELEYRSITSGPVVRVWLSTLERHQFQNAWLDLSCDLVTEASASEALDVMKQYLKSLFPPVFSNKEETGSFFEGGKL